MKNMLFAVGGTAVLAAIVALSSCATQEEMQPMSAPSAAPAPRAEAKAPEKAKATKLSGDIGLLDNEKNYMIVVTKEGKLVTINFDPKFQPVMRTPKPAKVADIGLGSQATVQYTKQGSKNVAKSIEFLPRKGE